MSLILGQGITGSVLAWELSWAGDTVHLIDRCESVSASRIAAGLITPVTGRRMTLSADFEQTLAAAADFYDRVRKVTGQLVYETSPSERYFVSDEEQDFFVKERWNSLTQHVEMIKDQSGEPVGFRMHNAGRLRVIDFLTVTDRHFAAQGLSHKAEIDVPNDIEVLDDSVKIKSLNLEGTRLFFCQGYQPELNPWFPDWPDAPAKGEILKVSMPSEVATTVTHRGLWLAPVLSQKGGDNEERHDEMHAYLLGATYNREDLSMNPTSAGLRQLKEGLKKFTEEPAQITGHFAAIRASMRNRQPVIAVHSTYRNLAVLNGMGSRASLMAPTAARQLLEILNSELPADRVPQGKQSVSLTRLAHSIARRAVRPGDFVIDATAGNGHDTVFLAACVTETGEVLAVDIQPAAIELAEAKVRQEGYNNVIYLCEDHAKAMTTLADSNRQARVVMFNLGYLPGSDKSRVTKADSTKTAIQQGLRLLMPGGVMTVTAYRGHPGGQEEAQAVKEVAKSLTGRNIQVDEIPGSESNPLSPVLFVFRAKSDKGGC